MTNNEGRSTRGMFAGRRVGLLGAMSIGIGGMVGGGIFAVLGEAVSLAHSATSIAFFVAGIVAFLTAYSYAKLSVRYPSQGGTIVYINRAFGNDLATGSMNMILLLSYLVTLSLYAVAFGSYAMTFFPGNTEPWLRHVLISIAIILPMAINLFNAGIVSKSETFIVIIKLVLLMVVIVAGASYVDTSRFNPDHWERPTTIVAAGMVIFIAYEGFELIANSAQEVRNPSRTLPRAFIGSVLFVIILYILIALITVGSVPEAQIEQVKDYVLAEAAKPSLGKTGFVLVAVSALLATFSAINATIYGSARLGFTLAKDGKLPDILEHKVWNEPVWGVLIVGAFALLIANLFDLTAIAIIGSAGFLLVFTVTNAAGVRLAKKTGGNKWISLFGSVACLASLVTLLVHTYKDNPNALWVFGSLIGAAVVFELTYGLLHRGPLKINSASGHSRDG